MKQSFSRMLFSSSVADKLLIYSIYEPLTTISFFRCKISIAYLGLGLDDRLDLLMVRHRLIDRRKDVEKRYRLVELQRFGRDYFQTELLEKEVNVTTS